MRHRKKTVILGREKGPRGALLKNLAVSVILYEKVETTEAKAKAIRPIVERCITLSKNPSLNTRRRLLSRLGHGRAVAKLIEVLGVRFKERAGGYTRITKTRKRVGDGGNQACIAFVD